MKLTVWTLQSQHSQKIFPKVIKDNSDIFANFILQKFNKCIIDGKFPVKLKKLDVSPVFRKGNHNDKTNFLSVSILPSLSKINEHLIYNQITNDGKCFINTSVRFSQKI